MLHHPPHPRPTEEIRARTRLRLGTGVAGSRTYLEVAVCSCYKLEVPKIIEQWLLFRYTNGEFTPLSKLLKTRAQAEKKRLMYLERERRTIGIGVIRTKS
jgi:hypothetical protein